MQHEEDPNRKALIQYIQKEIQGMNNNRELLEGVEKWKAQFLDNWEPDQTIKESLQQIQLSVFELVEDETFIDTYLMPLINHILDNLKERNDQIDEWIRKQIAVLVEKNHSQIGDLVQENLDKLDNETLTKMVENNVGNDPQWIRVNGAVCGFIIGIFLTGIQALFRVV